MWRPMKFVRVMPYVADIPPVRQEDGCEARPA
jgi:hypothetical protein